MLKIFLWPLRATKRRFTELITNPVTKRVSHTKLAASSAYFIGTICFLWFHCWLFNQNTSSEKVVAALAIMPELWLFYFGVIASHQGVNKFMALKRKTGE